MTAAQGDAFDPYTLSTLGDDAFVAAWFALGRAARDELPDALRKACFERYARLSGASATHAKADLARKATDAATVTTTRPEPVVELIQASGLTPEPVRWLWEGWLARGKLHILAGAPGTGKTTIGLALAAELTRGGKWPDGKPCGKPANVLIWSGEDDPSDTLLPRLLAMGADSRRVFFVGNVFDGANDAPRPFDPARDMPSLLAAKDAAGAGFALLDPLVNAVAGDSHKSADVRRDLAPLVELAALLDIGVLGVSHFTKGTTGRDPLERVTGSLAFGALARIVLAAAKAANDDDPERRVFTRAKSNIGPDGGGFAYRLTQTDVPGVAGLSASRVTWGNPLEGTARELLAQAETVEDSDERGATDEAADLLRSILEPGPVDVRAARDRLRREGFSDKQIRRARERLGVKRERAGFKNPTDTWALPTEPEDAAAPVDAPLMPVDAQTQNEGINGKNDKNEGINGGTFEVFE